MITKVAFVAHPTSNMNDMKQFYGEHLGLELTQDMCDMWCEFVTPEGKTLALDPHSAKMPDAKPYAALESDDIEADVERLKDVRLNEHEGREICKMAIVVDPDGQVLHRLGGGADEHRL